MDNGSDSELVGSPGGGVHDASGDSGHITPMDSKFLSISLNSPTLAVGVSPTLTAGCGTSSSAAGGRTGHLGCSISPSRASPSGGDTPRPNPVLLA